MKIGDVSRHRRFADPVRLRWYAYHRALRFAQRMQRVEAHSVLACGPPTDCGQAVLSSLPSATAK